MVEERTESVVLELIDFVTRIATSESRLWTLTREAKVTRKQAEDIHRKLHAQASPDESADRHVERGRTRSTCYDTSEHSSHDWDPAQGWNVKLWCPGIGGRS